MTDSKKKRQRQPAKSAKKTDDFATMRDLREMCCRVLGAPGVKANPDKLLETAAAMLRTLASLRDQTRGPAWLDQAANALSGQLLLIVNDWRDGEIDTVDEALGWSRPPHERRDPEALDLRRRIFAEVTLRMERDAANTSHVFDDIADDGIFPGLKWQGIRDRYYAYLPIFEANLKSHSGKSSKSAE